MLLRLLIVFTALALSPTAFGWINPAEARSHTFTIGERDFLLDGAPFRIRCGEIHFARVPREYWQHRLRLLRAMGMNAVCAYLFWNFHEYQEGQFQWQHERDVAEFCRLAQKEGLWVLLRPGPYACAEWDMGGLPWWLLRHENLLLRSSDPRFLDATKRWFREVGRVLAPLQVTRGGPILLVQVENEYGMYGDDAGYLGELRQQLIDSGFEVPFFACNPVHTLNRAARADLFQVVNFGKDPEGAFRALRKVQSRGPLMCGEYYPGWYDTWGQPHHVGQIQPYFRDLETMLEANASFSIYMAHGGTSFAYWAGANRPFRPDTTSYDYDAPISEAGWTGEKYTLTRQLMLRFLEPGELLPDPPAPQHVISVSPFQATEQAPLSYALGHAIEEAQPRSVEHYNVGHGVFVHRTQLPAGPAGELTLSRVHDFAWVRLGGTEVGVLDRRHGQYSVPLPQRHAPTQLEITVYSMGRVNIGVELHDRKGVQGPVEFRDASGRTTSIDSWSTQWLDFSQPLPGLQWKPIASAERAEPRFYRAAFSVTDPGDTFLDVSTWGKGLVWINGRCLGRFWNIGPTQTLYVPAPWLRRGENEVVVLDLLQPTEVKLTGLRTPILDQLRLEADFNRPRGFGKFTLHSVRYIHAGQFAKGSVPQDFNFDRIVPARQVGIESLDAHDGRPFAAIAELDLFDADGNSLSKADWTIAYVDSEELKVEDGSAENAINGQPSDHWHTRRSGAPAPHPHRFVIDLGKPESLRGFRYTPRTGTDDETGRIRNFRVYLGDKLAERASAY